MYKDPQVRESNKSVEIEYFFIAKYNSSFTLKMFFFS